MHRGPPDGMLLGSPDAKLPWHAQPEAEIISMAGAIFTEGQPLLDVLETLLDRTVVMRLKEDNAATLTIMKSGYSVRLSHASRTHRINVASLSETITSNGMIVEHVETENQAADGLTKVIQAMVWERVFFGIRSSA